MVKALRDAHLEDKLIFTHPAGYLNLVIQTGLYLGIVLASPYVLYQIWLFVAPGLYKHERTAVAGFIAARRRTLFCRHRLCLLRDPAVPAEVSRKFPGQGPFTPLISIEEYFDLVLIVLLGVGVVFELPMLIFVLSLFGIVTPSFLWKNFRYAILIIAIVAAIITPTPDATTMLIFMAPMIVLYVVGIGVSWVVLRRKRRREALPSGGA